MDTPQGQRFLKPIYTKEERNGNGPPGANQGLSTAEPDMTILPEVT